MYDFQGLIFRSASHWSEATALVVLGAGLLYTLQGFRFGRFLTVLSCAGGGLVLGAILANLFGFSLIVALGAGAAFGAVPLIRYRYGLALTAAFTGAALAQYLATQFGLRANMTLIAAGIGLVGGFSLHWVCLRTLPIIVTVVQGAGLLVVGFVSITNALAPSLGQTFVGWAASIPLMVPGFVAMLCVLGYSVQANALQGDMESGGDPSHNNVEAW